MDSGEDRETKLRPKGLKKCGWKLEKIPPCLLSQGLDSTLSSDVIFFLQILGEVALELKTDDIGKGII